MRNALLIASLALSAIVAATAFSPARAQNPAIGHVIVRCPRDGDTCVKFRCEVVGGVCERLATITQSRFEGWRRKNFRGDGQWAWYGPGLVNCDVDGSRCVLLKR